MVLEVIAGEGDGDLLPGLGTTADDEAEALISGTEELDESCGVYDWLGVACAADNKAVVAFGRDVSTEVTKLEELDE